MKYKLGDILESISETFDKNREVVVLINTSDVYDGKVLNHGFVKNANLKGQFKKKFQKGDILFSEIRPQNRRFAYVDFLSEGYVASTKLMVLRNISKMVSTRYLFHILKSQEIIDKLQILAESRSGTFPQITFSELASLEVEIPSLEIQTRIEFILDSIENKIKINNEINDNLEEQIRLLFNKYYESADNATVLSECCTLTSSKRVFAKDYVQEGVPFYRGKEITLKRNGKLLTDMLYISEEHYKEIKNKYGVPNVGDILLTAVGTLGNSYMVQEEKFYFKDGNIIWIKDFRSNEENYYIYDYMQSSLFSNAIESIRIGSTQSALTIVSLGKLKILLPNESNLIEYYQISKSIRDRINSNIKETEKLSELRDTLLPKLLSGELDLTNVELED